MTDPRPLWRRLDPAAWDTGLSPANARLCWQTALDALDAPLPAPPAGRPPRRVLLIGSANVFTAPIPWIYLLHMLGVQVRVKPARGQQAVVEALADGVEGVEVRVWSGGDTDAEADAMTDVDGVMAFGGAEAMAAIGARVPPGVVWLPFGPRFGVAITDQPGAAVVVDHVLYDGRGCMSPAAVFARAPDLDALAQHMAEAEARWPRGPLHPLEGARLRARALLARATGAVREGPSWAVLQLPLRMFSPEALPRCLVVHPFTDLADVAATLAPYRDLLGTVATDQALPFPAPRRCAPGEMQAPPLGRTHDGVDVLEALWRTQP